MIPFPFPVLRTVLLLIPFATALSGCKLPSGSPPATQVHHVGVDQADTPEWKALAGAFEARNPGYTLSARPRLELFGPVPRASVVFVQSGASEATIRGRDGTRGGSEVDVGDLVLLQEGETLVASPPVQAIVFGLPDPFPSELPSFVRPDWDPEITDTPGGCATETGAYRRILLTWLPKNGAYVNHSLNAHRVRITDSFTHYHPEEGGFDEFYLVQMVQPGARLLTSEAVDAIESEALDAAGIEGAFTERPLAVGDLVYMPRGTIHRGLDGVLAQVIAVPGFVPGMEIGVDDHLHAINAKLGLEGEAALPVHTAPR